MKTFFECIIKHPVSSVDSKKKNFSYVVEADTYTEAEADCYHIMEDQSVDMNEASIERISKLAATESLINDSSDEAVWFDVKFGIIVLDESSGEEIVASKEDMLVMAKCVEDAAKEVANQYSASDITITNVKRTRVTQLYMKEDIIAIEKSNPVIEDVKKEDDDAI